MTFLDGGIVWLYGEGGAPGGCPECGYRWDTTAGDALALIERAPDEFAAAVDGHDGMARPADGGWNATAYVWHLGDISRGWAERWVSLAADPSVPFAGWDPVLLAEARNYTGMPTVSALWQLSVSTRLLVEQSRALGMDASFPHPWGEGTVGQVLVWLAHEFTHHLRDVQTRAISRSS